MSSSGLSFGGLASGLDTASIVSQLMALERRPLDNLKAKQTAHGSKMAAVQSIKDLISSLQGAAKGLADRSKVNAKSATTNTPSTSPAILSASATADAINGSFKVTVKQLATSTRVTSGDAIGTTIDKNALLKDAGFRYSVNNGTFRINGSALTIDDTTTLSSLVGAIDAIGGVGSGVSASLVADADGRPENRVQIVGAAGQALQLGALGDTANGLRLLNLADAVVSGYTASSVTSGAADAGALNTTIRVNGVDVAINQNDGNFTAEQNAAFIAQAINNSADGTSLQATAHPSDGTLTLTHKTVGSQGQIKIENATGNGTGLTDGTVQNGTDRVVSSTNLGVTDISAQLGNARLETPITVPPTGGKFKINGVEVTYKSTDTMTMVLNRINASTAGVTASYDPVQDRVRLTAGQTGARSMTLEETDGNFLAATGLLGATQQLGQNAIFNIDSVNDGGDLSSNTNSVSGYVPGVTLSLKSASETPVTVTVAQDSGTATNTIKGFVTQFNAVLQKIDDLTKYDAENKRAAALTGESGIRDIQRQLRQMVSTAAIGATGSYRTLASIGVSFGAVGSALGQTDRLVVDESKLSKALTDNPLAVETVLSGFAATLGTPTGTNVAAVSGTPQMHQDGSYKVKVTDASTGAYEAKFVSTGGQTLWSSTGTMKAGEDSFSIIPGLKVTAGATLSVGESTIAVSVQNRGIGVAVNDLLAGFLSKDGYFADRKAGDDAISKSFTSRMAQMEDRLDRKQASLEKKYSTLESTLSKLQSQSNALLSQLAGLNSSFA